MLNPLAPELEERPLIVGVPKEVKDNEYRVALTPEGARELTHAGHRVLVQKGAGEGSSLYEQRYERAGAEMVGTAEDVWRQAEMILKVKEPIASLTNQAVAQAHDMEWEPVSAAIPGAPD